MGVGRTGVSLWRCRARWWPAVYDPSPPACDGEFRSADASQAVALMDAVRSDGVATVPPISQPDLGLGSFRGRRCGADVRSSLSAWVSRPQHGWRVLRVFLCHLEVPNSVRAVLFRNAPVAPSVPLVDAGATARTDLRSGEVLDGLVGFTTHGLPENHVIVGRREQSNQLDDASEVPR
jgi:hypothetical protein